MRIACRITKTKGTNSKYVILLFHSNNGFVNAHQRCVIRTLPVLLTPVVARQSYWPNLGRGSWSKIMVQFSAQAQAVDTDSSLSLADVPTTLGTPHGADQL